MKKYSILFLILLVFFLTACSKNDNTEIKQLEESYAPSISKLAPPELTVFTNNNSTAVILSKYCFPTDGKACKLEADNPSELLRGHGSMAVKSGEKIMLSLTTSNLSLPKELLAMENVNVNLIQFYKKEQTKINVDVREFTAPQEPGRYYYLATLTWDGDIKGVANYAFSFAVVE